MFKKQFFIIFLVFVLIGLGYISLKEISRQSIDYETSNNLIEKIIAPPEWWNSIDAPIFKTVNNIDTEWQGRKRCCVPEEELIQNNRIFYKACYNYINNNSATEEGIVKCLWLMGASETIETRRILGQFLYDNYSNHKGRTDNCVNCAPADTIIRATQNLAGYYKKYDINKSIELLETILDKRKDISPWVELETIQKLARYYNKTGLNKEQANRLQVALDKFKLAKNDDSIVQKRFIRFKKTIDKALQNYTLEE